MEISFTLTQDDLKAFHQYTAHHRAKGRRLRSGIVFVLSASGGFGLIWFLDRLEFSVPSALFGGFLVYVLMLIVWLRAYLRSLPAPDGFVLGPQVIDISNQGIAHRKEHYQSWTGWQAIQSVEQGPCHIYIFLDNCFGLVIPKRALNSAERYQDFNTALSNHLAARVTPDEAAAPGDGAGMVSTLLKNLRAGFRLATFQPVRAGDFVVRIEQLALLISISVLLDVAYHYFTTTPPRDFSTQGVSDLAAFYLVSLAAVVAITAAMGKFPQTMLALTMLIALEPVTELAAYVAAYDASRGFAHWWLAVLSIWVLLASARAFLIALSPTRTQLALIILFYMMMTFGSSLVLPQPALWYSHAQSEYSAAKQPQPVNVEDTFYAQPGLLEQALGELAPHRENVADLYFVGFGSYGSQDVFMHEVDYIRRLFDARFNTAGRSINLVNNRDTATQFPLANTHNLDRVLKTLARRMNTEEDILFMYLTSHGNEDGTLVVEFWPLELNPLDAKTLRSILDESGIKWRVLVVSSCYSGGFITSLQDDHTLVITAAAEDRTSFGCSNERKFTYFGEAYFKDALGNGTSSFVDAFYQARELISQRETEQDLTPSLPQIRIGKYIKQKLHSLDGAAAPY